MSEATNPVASTNSVTPNQAAQAAAASVPAAAVDISSTISSMNQLQAKAPKVYYQMMLGIATTMINEMSAEQAHLKEIEEEAREDAGES